MRYIFINLIPKNPKISPQVKGLATKHIASEQALQSALVAGGWGKGRRASNYLSGN